MRVPSGRARITRLWWATAASGVLAIGLYYLHAISTGPIITVTFPHGHGLEAGSPVRLLGVDVGQVESLAVDSDLRPRGGLHTAFPGSRSRWRDAGRTSGSNARRLGRRGFGGSTRWSVPSMSPYARARNRRLKRNGVLRGEPCPPVGDESQAGIEFVLEGPPCGPV